jgi:hypothetical protein
MVDEFMNEKIKAEILEAINDSFKEILGESGTKAIYYYFQVQTGMKVEEAIESPEIFVSFLRNIFKAGSQILERRIIEKLCDKFSQNLEEEKNIDLTNLIKKLLKKK